MDQPLKKCPYCGEMVPEKAIKCRFCAEVLEEAGEQPAAPRRRAEPPPPPKKSSTCLILALVGLGILGLLAGIGVFAYMAVAPQVRRMRGRSGQAREAYVVGCCTDIADAQETYYARNDVYGSLRQLADTGLADPELASGASRGYRFDLKVPEDGQDWSMQAWPVRPHGSTKSYYVDSTAEVRSQSYTSVSDEKAGPDSPPIWGWAEEEWDD